MLHLIHPALLHFTVAFLIVGGGVEAAGLWTRRESLERLGAVLFALGVASLVPTAASGFLAANSVDVPPATAAALDRHEASALVLLAVGMGLLLWKAWGHGRVREGQRSLYAAALVVAAALTVVTAFFGGVLVYGEGVGTAPVKSAPTSP